jgi:hypothetical protein
MQNVSFFTFFDSKKSNKKTAGEKNYFLKLFFVGGREEVKFFPRTPGEAPYCLDSYFFFVIQKFDSCSETDKLVPVPFENCLSRVIVRVLAL